MGLFDSDAQSSKPVHYVQVRTKNKPYPVFEIKSKDSGKISEVKAIDGNIVGFVPTEHTDKDGNVIKGFRLSLDSTDGFALLSIGYTQVGRSLMNALLSLKDAHDVRLSLYKNKEGYDQIGVTQNKERVSWKFPMSEVPKPEEVKNAKGENVMVSGKKVMEWEHVNEFFKKHLDEKFVGTNFTFAKTDNTVVASAHADVPTDTDLPEMKDGPWSEEAPAEEAA